MNRHVMTVLAALCSFVGIAADVRLAPMGRIVIEEADVTMAPAVFYPGWTSRHP